MSARLGKLLTFDFVRRIDIGLRIRELHGPMLGRGLPERHASERVMGNDDGV